MIAICNRVGGSLQHNASGTTAENRSVRATVERAAMTIGRENTAFFSKMTGSVWHADGDSTGKCHVALFIQQTLTSRVNRNQRGRASRLDRQARSGEIHFVRDACCQKVFVTGDQRREILRCESSTKTCIEKIRIHGRARVDADAAIEAIGSVACIFQGAPAALEKDPLLGIDQRRVTGRVAEEGRIE